MRLANATLVGILNSCNKILIQLFIARSLINVSRSKLLSLEVYHSKKELESEVTILAYTMEAPFNVIKF